MSSNNISFQTAERLSRVGEYYFSKKLAEIARMKAKGIPVFNLGIGNPDQPPHPKVIETLHEASLDPANHGYQSYRGIPELRAAFAEWYQRHYGVGVNPENEVLPLIGSKEGIMHIAMSFLQEGDIALVPNPGYPTYSAATKLTGATAVEYTLKPERGWKPDFEEIIANLDMDRVKIMWLNYPHMPTGTAAEPELFKELVYFARKYQVLLVHDNPYSFILHKPTSILSIEGASEVVIELNSLSKSHNMAGWRIGAMLANADLIAKVLRFKSNMDSGQFKPLQLATVTALSLGENWIEAQNQRYRQRRKMVYEILDLIGCTYKEDQAGMFVWARIPDGFDDGFACSQWLLKELWLFITPGGIFGNAGNRYIRISLCNPETVLEEAIHRIKKGALPEKEQAPIQENGKRSKG